VRRAVNQGTLDDIASLLRSGDWAGLAQHWAEDGVMELPYAPGGPQVMRGREEIARNNVAGLALFSRFETPVFTTYATTDPNVFFAEYRSKAVVRATGKPYRNTYVAHFRFREGKVVHWKEYFDPAIIREAFRP
jgi:hypothetical protein